MRAKVLSRQYVMTLHAEEEMNNDGLTIFDIEEVILTGGIIERQIDQFTGEYKYVILGSSVDRQLTIVVSKISTRDKLIIITVFLDN